MAVVVAGAEFCMCSRPPSWHVPSLGWHQCNLSFTWIEVIFEIGPQPLNWKVFSRVYSLSQLTTVIVKLSSGFHLLWNKVQLIPCEPQGPFMSSWPLPALLFILYLSPSCLLCSGHSGLSSPPISPVSSCTVRWHQWFPLGSFPLFLLPHGSSHSWLFLVILVSAQITLFLDNHFQSSSLKKVPHPFFLFRITLLYF